MKSVFAIALAASLIAGGASATTRLHYYCYGTVVGQEPSIQTMDTQANPPKVIGNTFTGFVPTAQEGFSASVPNRGSFWQGYNEIIFKPSGGGPVAHIKTLNSCQPYGEMIVDTND